MQEKSAVKALSPVESLRSPLIPVFVKLEHKGLVKPHIITNVDSTLGQVCDEILSREGRNLLCQLVLNGRWVTNADYDKPVYYFGDKKHWLIVCYENIELRTLADYNIQKESTLQLVMSLRGGCGGGGDSGGHSFADLSSSSLIGWSSEAPRWRMACRGLCIEGKCLNSQCDAYQQMVICPRGFSEFSLEFDRAFCPVCEHPFKAVTAAFNNCQFYFFGVYADKAGVTVHKHSPSEKVGDVYRRFDDKTKDGASMEVKWQFLKLVAAGLKEKLGYVCLDTQCPVCCDDFHSLSTDTTIHKCGHRFHKVCLDLNNSVRPGCPRCDGEIKAMVGA